MSPLLKKTLIALALIPTAAVAVWFSLYAIGYRYYGIPTGSMEPLIAKNSHVFGKVSNGYRDNIKRFDIAVYKQVKANESIYAKRVIGLPGEHIKISGKSIMIDGKPLALPDSVNIDGLASNPCELTIPNDAVFVLGDNTKNSMDSRYFGPVPKTQVIGKILLDK